MATEPSFPVRDIRWVLHACQADKPVPPGDPRRHDFRELRGEDVVTELAVRLQQSLPDAHYHHQLLCGHRGAGKSTELLALKDWADQQGFLTIWVEVDVHFGSAELQFSDLYLLAATLVAEKLDEIGTPLPEDKLDRVTQWFAKVTEQHVEQVKSELSVEAGVEAGVGVSFVPLLGKLFTRFASSVKAGSDRQKQVRQELRQAPDTLIDLTSDLLETANQLLHDDEKQPRPKGLLLLFDNLDRYDATTITTLLLNGATLIRRLAAHAVFTLPINLHYHADETCRDEYGPAAVLPMLPLRVEGTPWRETVEDTIFDEKAVDVLIAALNRRLNIEKLFEDPADARLLVKMSGGCMRDLLHLVAQAMQKSHASLDAKVEVVTKAGVRKGIQTYRLTLTEGLREDQYKRLAGVARRDPESLQVDEVMIRWLQKRITLRYPGSEHRWTDVHPLVIETEGFRRASIALSPLKSL